MLKKEDVLNILKVGFILFVITAVSALILAVVNAATAPVIAENVAEKQTAAMKKVLPDAVEFVEAEQIAGIDWECPVSGAYSGINAGNECVGYAVMVSSNGYGGAVSLAVGVDNEMKVTGIDVISHSETAGLGAKCTTESFKAQFIGKRQGIVAVKNGAKDNQIDAISSATITSKAVTAGVNTALAVAQTIKEAE